ncbi:unnamed protein product [Rotaria socialis]|uniref:SH2 domain-containing protein n=1 Tax=Rotaria socialis TaxID=392032 RepID=A0A817T3C1_9BILA|nr:unnamed protein product [Rotaria socialis]CAF3320901.1 unnamed protein product [Rotaria socialis]CAF3384167.1 unnamed protein product [Rotaria socialis]CAF3611250.1 unnamed protein product [Rotaria socialis]CAF4309447.1 unnamed protein product [Rotaria socialis]
MLAQILHDLHVPKEILDELPEDQKQILFCKMREEQVRRYHEREAEENFRLTGHISKKKKQVTFRLDNNGHEWCLVMGETLENNDDEFHNRTNNENMEIDYQSGDKQLSINTSNTHTFPATNGVFYTVHRDERKQIEEISNNIQEARRIFERLETETRRLALSKENEIFQKQKRPQTTSIPISQSDFVDEIFYHEIEKRAKQADQERREAARRARDLFHRQSVELNVCLDTDKHTEFTLQPIPLNSSNRTIPKEKKLEIEIEVEENKTPAFPIFTLDNSNKLNIEDESKPTSITVGHQQSKSLSSITRADIHQWFYTNEIPYGTFRSSNGQIYPWFHGIITRAYTEQLLSSKPVGTYLVRVSEKMFGYVLSYLASDHCRHLLIEVTQQEHTYRFLGGAKNELFEQLSQLIEKYTNTPIRSNSTDVLRFPCGQIDPERTDYTDLFVDNSENEKFYEYLCMSLGSTASSLQSTTHL